MGTVKKIDLSIVGPPQKKLSKNVEYHLKDFCIARKIGQINSR